LRTALQAIKRARMSFVYYPLEMERELLRACHTDSAQSAVDIIKTYEELTNWLFEDPNKATVTMFSSRTLEITYDSISAKFAFTLEGCPRRVIDTFNDFVPVLDSVDPKHFKIAGFDLSLYLKSLAKVIPCIEKI
jgi:hypothetical protein